MQARRLLCVIVRQAYHGTLLSKTPGRATMPEIHEACGLDVDEMQSLLSVLRDAGLITIEGAYPFEEIRLEDEDVSEGGLWRLVLGRCESAGMELEACVVNLQFGNLLDL
jgi:hypothetical protein